MRRLLALATLLSGLALACPASAVTPLAARVAPSASSLHLPVERFTLANGLRVVLHADPTLPTVAIALFYDVGSRNEIEGRTGFAHMFEHMMFQGSANMKKGEHPKLVVGRGGTLGAGTAPDLTLYSSTLPASEIALGLWVEADRMRSLDVTPENFLSQREVVKEEVLGGLSGGQAHAWLRLEELMFAGNWPYAHPTGGRVEDLDRAEFAWIKAFHDQYYGPNNAVLSVAGSLDIDAVKGLIHKYFDSIPRVATPPYVEPPPPPEPRAPRDETMKDPALRSPGLMYGWVIPPNNHPDHYPLTLASKLLGDGDASRLRQALISKKALARSVDVALNTVRRGPDSLTIDIKPAEGVSLADAERAVEAEVNAMARAAPSAKELDRLHKRARADLLFKLDSHADRSTWLGFFELLYGDAALLDAEIARYQAVTSADIQRVVARYLTPNRRVRIEVLPTEVKK